MAALKVLPALSLGASIALRYSLLDAVFDKARIGTTFPYRMRSKQETTGTALSVDAGLLWEPLDRWAVGAVLRLPYDIVKEGDTEVVNSLVPLEVSRATTVRESIPARATVGAAFRPSGGRLLTAGLSYLAWSDYRRRTTYDEPVPGILEDTDGNLFAWQDAWVAGLGYRFESEKALPFQPHFGKNRGFPEIDPGSRGL